MKFLSIISISVLVLLATGCDEMQNQVMKPMTMPDDETQKDETPIETEVTMEDTLAEVKAPEEDKTGETKGDQEKEPSTEEEIPIEGASDDIEDSMEDPPVVPQTPVATFVSASPASGDISENDSITINFDNNPGTVTTSAGTVSGSGNSRSISGPFSVGSLSLTISWTNGDGSHTLSYNVMAEDTTSPDVTTSSLSDGAVDVDPATVFESGITITFSEPISSGSLKLLKNGVDVGWTVSIDGNTITLTANTGQELSHETEYTISGTVRDSNGNEKQVSITFTTESAPAPPSPPVTLDPGEGLSIGTAAPDFTLPDGNGNNYTLSDSIGSSNIVIVFFRGNW